MPTNLPQDNPVETPRGPTPTPGLPDRSLEKPPLPPALDPDDNRNPNDPTLTPALMPMGDPAGAA